MQLAGKRLRTTMRIILRSYNNAYQKFPLRAQSIQSATVMGTADLISQFVIEKKELSQLQWQRTARFAALGLCAGPTLRIWFGILERRIGSGSARQSLMKVALDQAAFAPCSLLTFLTILGAIKGQSVQMIIKDIKENYLDILLKSWTLWPAVQICNFLFIPIQYQVLYIDAFALCWSVYMAWKTNRDENTSC